MPSKKIFALVLVLFHVVPPSVLAQSLMGQGLSLSDELAGQAKGNEWVSGATKGGVLMQINLWGAVNKTGIHYVPTNTDLITLLSYAGGPMSSAELDEITIRRKVNGKDEQVKVDLDDILHSKAVAPKLEPNDIILIPSSPPVVSNNTLTVVSLVGGILGIVLASIVINDRFSTKK